MKILFTGASSFTGYWFVKHLCDAGHDVTCIFTKKSVFEYDGIRRLRIDALMDKVNPAFDTQFGSEGFISIIQNSAFDVLCHHAAEVRNYKDPNFDVVSALKANTLNISHVFEALKTNNCGHVLITGSVFEGGEGMGTDGLDHFSPYGLSKALTSEMFHYYAKRYNIPIGKFIVPNPFGPLEEKRFTHYLITQWMDGKTPNVSTPLYLRDNIHISLLADYYVYFLQKLVAGDAVALKISPSGYAGSQADFVDILSRQMSSRLLKPCNFNIQVQTDFNEPLKRVNFDKISTVEDAFDESKAWDDLKGYYVDHESVKDRS